jgi:integrase/recombinase XerC
MLPSKLQPASAALGGAQGGLTVEQARRLLQSFLGGLSLNSRRAYRQDLVDFATFVGASTPEDAAGRLLGGQQGQANAMALEYKNHLTDARLSPATINRRLAALRSLSRLSRTLGLTSWAIEVKNVKSEALRDTRGCGIDGFRQILAVVEAQRDVAKVARDRAILHLLFDLALRRCEITRLDLEDVDLAGSRLLVQGKGKMEKAPMSLPEQTKKALESWIAYRGNQPGPLLTNRDRAKKGLRLSGTAIYQVVRHLGDKAGVRNVRPHGLRHAAITTLLDLTNGNVRMGQSFARHASPSTTMRYDDARKDQAGEAAKILANAV